MKKLHIYTTIAITAVLLSIQGCGGGGGYGGGGGGGGGGQVATIAIVPMTSTIAPTGTQQYMATAKDSSGNVLSGVTYNWNTSNSSIATINANGLATGVADGTAMITASVTYPAGGIYMMPTTITSNSATLTVAGADMVMGTAAVGRAFVSALVSLKDSTGQTQMTTTDTQGRFLLAAGGLTPPFILKVADDQGHVMFSLGNGAGVINIDPFTDTIARLWYQAHGSSVEAAFANPRGQSIPDDVSLKTLDSTLVKSLTDALTAQGLDPATVSFLHTPFTANGTGLDGVLDHTTFSLRGGSIVMSNTVAGSGQEITLSTTNQTVIFHTMGIMEASPQMTDLTLRLAH